MYHYIDYTLFVTRFKNLKFIYRYIPLIYLAFKTFYAFAYAKKCAYKSATIILLYLHSKTGIYELFPILIADNLNLMYPQITFFVHEYYWHVKRCRIRPFSMQFIILESSSIELLTLNLAILILIQSHSNVKYGVNIQYHIIAWKIYFLSIFMPTQTEKAK